MPDEIHGPVDLVVVAFPGSHFTGDLLPALGDVVASGAVRIIDLVFITRAADGGVDWLEVTDLPPAVFEEVDALDGEVTGLMTDEDLRAAGEDLRPGDSALAVLLDHLWAARLADAVSAADGQVTLREHIPVDLVRQALAETAPG